ncbi:hypothetical protein ACJIZ3_009103 [Penstemon smallii]|uniref:UDP-glycosyltransferases domain-containing protein n=1 Tax=Penstemon smallii TaxID=265156 RepID=A0ABD3TDH8_9LAMI
MSYIQDPEAIPMLFKIMVRAFDQVKNADFILYNTVQELESEALSALNEKHPTYAIGPINFFNECKILNIAKSLWAESDITRWLESKPPGSVMYISFGSIAQITKQEIEEITHGLLISQVSFVYILRPNGLESNETNIFPVGFENDIIDRGLIVPWCNQNMVLSNPAIGGFVTHCGWNSIIESMWFGVPMICYPFLVDQPTNRKLVVENWKIGINLCDGDQIKRHEVAHKIKILMNGEYSIKLRQEINKLRKVLHNALDIDGSSQRNFDQFVEDLKVRLYAKS